MIKNISQRILIRFAGLLSLAMVLGACGGNESGDSASSTGNGNAAPAGEPSAMVQLGEQEIVFNGGRCFLTEDGGSDGAIDLTDALSANGDDLSVDWAGDSPSSARLSIEMADGTEYTTPAFGITPENFRATVSGRSATVETTVQPLIASPEPVLARVELTCP